MNPVILAATRLARCPQCWQQTDRPCTARGDHLARYQAAEHAGLISREELAAVIASLEVIAGHMIIPRTESAA